VASPFAPRRRATREVRVGDVGIGGANPIRIQSMTTTDTKDVAATVDQAEQLAAAGCEIVRVTAPSITDAEALGEIRAELDRRGVRVPLVADIHYTPNAAMLAAEHVEKVRINPGNYADKKKFAVREYGDAEWAEEVARVAEKFRPLVRRCRELGRAMRIGTNHGSLADRILNRYGDTPEGMVQSALEFLDVCEDEGYRDVVFSMKASNPQVAIQAYRLLAARLEERAPGEPSYPFHVGVTEAGSGEDGRIKSAIGIGALLEDGIGETIRVSLTEHPVKEVPVARALAARYEARRGGRPIEVPDPGASFCDDPYDHARRATRAVAPDGAGAANAGPAGAGTAGRAVGGDAPVRAELDLGPAPADPAGVAARLALALSEVPNLVCEGLTVAAGDEAGAAAVEALAAELRPVGVDAALAVCGPSRLAPLVPSAARWVAPLAPGADPAEALAVAIPLELRLEGSLREVVAQVDAVLDAAGERADLLFSTGAVPPVHATRLLAARLRARGAAHPIVLRHLGAAADPEAALLAAATDLGAPLCDGLGDAIVLPAGDAPDRALSLAYRILQGARLRTTWTEFISCPSCGRTLFDLEEVTERIQGRTGHLEGVKIAIMGCIVNGPGEMADADFGYVGSGPGRINLYVGKELVERNVPEAEADDRLVELIRKHGRWIDPPGA
jgi:(E)-4-hydroxy-3-methylbut-2-enyl-diphosphate synthase